MKTTEKTPLQKMNDVNVKAAELLLEQMQLAVDKISPEKGRMDMLAKLGAVIAGLTVKAELPDFTQLMQMGFGKRIEGDRQ